MPRPAEGDVIPYFFLYINQAKGDNVAELIQNHSEEIKTFYSHISPDKENFAYADGKWTVKEVLQHVIDAERVFAYRALRIARKDSTPLSSFDENLFAKTSMAHTRSLSSLQEELNAVRKATDLLFQSFNDDQINSRGIASNNPITVNALAFITYGHALHHKRLLQEKYLV